MKFEYRRVNVYNSVIPGVVITDLDDNLDELFEMLEYWSVNGIPIRIYKKFVIKYSYIFNIKGWNIDPRDWTYTDPLRFCMYASVKPFLYISPKNYD
jgi:hypothetical protein